MGMVLRKNEGQKWAFFIGINKRRFKLRGFAKIIILRVGFENKPA